LIAGDQQLETDFTSSVQTPVEVLAEPLQNRSEFSHSVIPDLLSSKSLR
jgi:hypothetical protein